VSIAMTALAMHAASADPITAPHPVPSIQDTETPAERDARMRWFREARFGMFIHWGLYSIPAGTWRGEKISDNGGEWIMNQAEIPVADYKALARQFNPTKFSAHEMVGLARKAGAKYIVFTAKHHDGFAMYDSKADPFNIVDATPFKRDVLKDLAGEARAQGVKLGIYYSQVQDWAAPGGNQWPAIGKRPMKRSSARWDPAQEGDFADYVHHKAIPQLRELLTQYGSFPDYLFLDTPAPEMTPELAGEIVKVLNLHPKLIWDDRLGGGYAGDTQTPEEKIPAQGLPGRDWEACMTMNGTWGYKADAQDYKSSAELIRNLIDTASKGGNFLLNVGPDASGQVPKPQIERMLAIGKWLKVNGEAIYATQATVLGDSASWRSTTAEDKLYIHLLQWPGQRLHIDKVPREVTGAYLLADVHRRPLKVVHDGDGIDVSLPAKTPDPIATVLVLTTTQKK
jgi:alpha-L-fucosidase